MKKVIVWFFFAVSAIWFFLNILSTIQIHFDTKESLLITLFHLGSNKMIGWSFASFNLFYFFLSPNLQEISVFMIKVKKRYTELYMVLAKLAYHQMLYFRNIDHAPKSEEVDNYDREIIEGLKELGEADNEKISSLRRELKENPVI